MSKSKEYGIENFLKKRYDNAIFHFSLALQENVNDLELQTYLNLAYLAKTNEYEATMLFSLYSQNAISSIDDLQALNRLSDFAQSSFEDIDYEEEMMLQAQNGISYKDFLQLVKQRGSFTKAFEDIMFCTKVLISKKDDFLHFLNLLVENGYEQMALNYLENASFLFPAEPALQEIAKKVSK